MCVRCKEERYFLRLLMIETLDFILCLKGERESEKEKICFTASDRVSI